MMPAIEENVVEEEQRALAVALAWVAGYVDAVGYILLFGLFTAHMSGNTVRLGVDLGRGDASEALARAVPIGVFVIGVALGTLLVELAARDRFSRWSPWPQRGHCGGLPDAIALTADAGPTRIVL